MRQKRGRGSSDSFTTGRELGRFGGSGDFRTALRAICQKSKPFPISASPFSLSLAALTLHHNICFLSPMSHPLLTVSHLFFSHAPEEAAVFFTACSLKRTRKFLIHHHSGNKLIFQRTAAELNLFRFVRDSWTHGETEPAP